MTYLDTVIETVDKTHPQLGRPVVVSLLAVKATKFLIMVSPRGCGKSRVSSYVGGQSPKSIIQDRLSVAGLQTMTGDLSGFTGVVVVDDIAKSQTSYARITTITTLAELTYSHYIKSALARSHFSIENFYGSAIVNAQPVLVAELVRSSEWEASIQDKSVRYYHLKRPVEPNPDPPQLTIQWGLQLDSVKRPKFDFTAGERLLKLTEIQWGLARQREHLTDLLKASAAFDNRKVVEAADYKLLERVLAPLAIEELVMTKSGFESGRQLSANQLAVLTEFASYGQFTLRQLSQDYKLSESRCYQIMDKYAKDWRLVRRSPTTYAPTPELKKRLTELGIM